jgi:hypothetical protein
MGGLVNILNVASTTTFNESSKVDICGVNIKSYGVYIIYIIILWILYFLINKKKKKCNLILNVIY